MPSNINDIQVAQVEGSWSVTSGLLDNALATATRAAEPGRRHVMTKIEASYSSSSTSGLLVVRRGSTVIARKHIHGAGAMDLGDPGFVASTNEAVSAELSASGTAGVTGTVTVLGFTVQD